jgi:hypothetical protein
MLLAPFCLCAKFNEIAVIHAADLPFLRGGFSTQ